VVEAPAMMRLITILLPFLSLVRISHSKQIMAPSKVCAVFGYGPGLGAAMARKWSKEGFQVAIMSRSLDKVKVCRVGYCRLPHCTIIWLTLGLPVQEDRITDTPLFHKQAAESDIPNSKGYACDVTKPDDVEKTVVAIEKEMGPIDTVVYNAGNGLFKTWDKIPIDDFEKSFQTNVSGLLAATQNIAPQMIQRGSGSIMITGATASLRGKPFTAGFAPAKGAQRLLAQSLARDLGPKGVHVGYFIIDGYVGKDDSDPSKLDPNAVADHYFHVSTQPKNCWTFESEVRPSVENW
jgi:NAD(P)-dependent dehydrogenase (short-subunit alcohol dehydrogenase family)